MPRRRHSPSPTIRIDPSLTFEQHLAALELIPLAIEGLLFGCHCAADGKTMPCACIIEAVKDDAALGLIRASEQRSKRPGTHNLRSSAAKLASDEEYAVSKRPLTPTDAEPGSDEKKAVLRERIRRGESVGREDDRFHRPARLEGEGRIGIWEEEEADDDLD